MRISDWSSDVCSSDLESRRSATVAKLDLRRLIHVFETISELEGLCARFAARRMTASERGELSDSHAARSEEHTSELQSLMRISYAVFCLKKKTHNTQILTRTLCTIIYYILHSHNPSQSIYYTS